MGPRDAQGDPGDAAAVAALRLLAAQARSRRELALALGRKGFGPAAIAGALARLAGQGYLDDLAFALARSRSRAEVAGWGRARVRQDLRGRGVPEAAIAAALAETFADVDEAALARRVAARKVTALRGVPPPMARRRLAGHLERRGFPADLIAGILRELIPGSGQDAEPD